jgi:isoleucyl-tRNA synthetase
MSFKPVSSQVDFPALEEEMLKFWEEKNLFKRSIEQRKGQERFVFYEGPPTANGKPHMGHVLQRAIKDLVLRYKTMKGFYADRRAGWDTHGLPVEIEVEKELGLRGKQDILNLKENEFESIKFFNEKCRDSVFKYVDEWKNLTERVGFWIDFDRAYVTYHNDYIESIWWFISQMQEKGLLYKDYKVVPYCPRCGTSLSSHELAQGYKDNVEDPSIYIKFELENEPGTFILVMTTTPWTLPGNVALAVGKNIQYVKVGQNGEKYILAKKRIGEVISGEFNDLGEVNFEDLIGKSYKPLYPYLNPDKKAYFIAEAGFASDEEGTGIVHTAVMYGVEDFELGQKLDLPKRHLVNLKGEFVDEVEPWKGMFVKKANPLIIEELKERNLLYKEEVIKHTYPFCWRCGAPILYYALDSWFIKVTEVKDKLLEDNQAINWQPKEIKTGRMKNWFETLIDWNISRNRFWGTPMPIWECENGHLKVIGGRDQLKELGAEIPEDLHRPYIDQVAFKCPECQVEMKRVQDVMDVWLDSGGMPFAQWHYPFENQEEYEEWYPADFIVEAIDQTRGWFYTLMAEAMLLGNPIPAPFKNVITTGHVLDEKGQKMSKSKGNVVDPMEVIPITGADTLRWYIFTSGAPGASFPFSIDLVKEKSRKFTLILWNCYKFFIDYATLSNWACQLEVGEPNVMDRWVLARLTKVALDVNSYLDKYDPTSASRTIEDFVVNDLSTWYIRRNRDRMGPEADDKERNKALSILYGTLVALCRLTAPFTPFLAEIIYQNLDTGDESVHLTDYPKGDKSLLDEKLVADMKIVREIVERGHAKRKESSLKLRQPLASVTYFSAERLSDQLEQIIAAELNVKKVLFNQEKSGEIKVELDINITPELQKEGDAREIIRQIQQMRKESNLTLKDKIIVGAPSWPIEFQSMIMAGTATINMVPADQLKIIEVKKD